MAVPAGIPWMLVFTGIFAFLVLFVACIALSVIVSDKFVRAGLVVAALMLAGVMGGAFLTMTGSEEEETAQAEEAAVPPPEQTAQAQPAEEKESPVVLVVDEATIQEDFDPLKTDRLSVEDPARGKTAGSADAQRERAKVGQEITAIETELNNRLLVLESQVQAVRQRFDAQQIDNYDMIFWQAKLKKQQYGFIVRTMDEKQKLLEKATTLPAEEKEADLAKIDKRRQKALEKWKEYHGALQELTANQDAFRTL